MSEYKRVVLKSDDERLHDLALLYIDLEPEISPAEFYDRYIDVKDQMRTAQKKHIQSFKQGKPPRSPV